MVQIPLRILLSHQLVIAGPTHSLNLTYLLHLCRTHTSKYILSFQEKLLGLMSLPTKDKYEELKEQRKEELERRLQQERQVEHPLTHTHTNCKHRHRIMYTQQIV